jgi:hypothetical protein
MQRRRMRGTALENLLKALVIAASSGYSAATLRLRV